MVHVDDESSVPSFSDQVQYETEAYAEEFLVITDPDRELVKGFGLGALPALVHVRQDLSIAGSAEGYFDEEQEVSGDKPIDVPVSLTLRERPAFVTVAYRAPAEVYVDGRIAATTPLTAAAATKNRATAPTAAPRCS